MPATAPAPSPLAQPPAATPRTLISVATYNEIENLPSLVEAIWQVAPQADILVIDDNSPDGTGRWCDEQAAAESRFHCVHRSGKLGLGTAIVAALNYGREHGYDYVLNMDADFSHHPRYIPAMLAAMEGAARRQDDSAARGQNDSADVVIGSRYCPGGGTKDWPFRRRFMSWAVNTYARWLLGLKPKDTSGGYRCYRTSLLDRVDLSQIKSRGYSFQEEILWRLKRVGARFAETPIIFADRERGQSKINKQEALAAIWIIFRLGVTNWLGI